VGLGGAQAGFGAAAPIRRQYKLLEILNIFMKCREGGFGRSPSGVWRRGAKIDILILKSDNVRNIIRMLSLSVLSLADRAVFYDRLSSDKQLPKDGSGHKTHLELLHQYATSQRVKNISIVTEVCSSYNNHEKQKLFSEVLTQSNISIYVVSADRLARTLSGAAQVIEKSRANNITIHVVGGDHPYVCDPHASFVSSEWKRLHDEMIIGYLEAKKISDRSKMYHNTKKMEKEALIASGQGPKPLPLYLSFDTMHVLEKLLLGCDNIQEFYKQFNRITPFGTTEEKMGDQFYLPTKSQEEYTKWPEYEFSLKKILTIFNTWEVPRRNGYATLWTGEQLGQVILYYFGQEVYGNVGEKLHNRQHSSVINVLRTAAWAIWSNSEKEYQAQGMSLIGNAKKRKVEPSFESIDMMDATEEMLEQRLKFLRSQKASVASAADA